MCAILSKYYSFTNPFSAQWTFWYIREASTALLVANMPMCWSLMRRLFNIRSFNNSSYGQSHTGPTTNGGRGFSSKKNGTLLSSVVATKTNKAENRGNVSWWEREGNGTQLGKTESEENIVDQKPVPLEIWASKQFDVDRESIIPGSTVVSSGSPPVTIHEGVVYGKAQTQCTSKATIITTTETKERGSSESR